MYPDKPLSPTELKRLHRSWRRRSELRLSLILDGVQKPYNVGGLLRSAAAYTVETVWAIPPTPGPDHSAVAKTALGSDRFVNWVECPSGPDAVIAAKEQGFNVVAIELTSAAAPLFTIDAGDSVCLILGHEERGIHRDTLAAADQIGFLPQRGKIGSLNVAQAGTVAMYEIARQSWKS